MSLRPGISARRVVVGAIAAVLFASVAHAGLRRDSGYAYGTSDDGLSYIIVRDGGENMSGSGDLRDYDRIRTLTDRYGKQFVWFRVDGKSYVIDDEELVQEAIDAVEPVRLLGKAQGKLGATQGRLGAKQGRLGAQQGRLGARQASLAMRQMALSRRIEALEMRGESTRELRRQMRELEALQEDLGREQERLGEIQGELGAEQGPLGKQQEKLGARQAEFSKKLQEDMRRIIEDAIDRDLAERVR
jgi:hypothetical protein